MRLPAPAAVVRAVDVRPHVVAADGVDRDVGGVGVEVPGVDLGDLVPGAQLRWGDVFPGRPPSRVTWTSPSSVPAQIVPISTGDGETA